MARSKLLLLATTRNRPKVFLERLFNSLAMQENKNFTLCLADQSRNEICDSLLHAYEGKFSFQVVKISPCSLSEARNYLLKIIPDDYDWLTLTDDDCYYAPNTFSCFVKYLEIAPSASVFAGNSCASYKNCTESLHSIRALNRFTAMRKAPSYVLFFRRMAIESVGLFDTCMGIGCHTPWQSGEETDVLIRMLAAGHAVYRAKGINVLHDSIFKEPLDTQKIRTYGAGRMYLLAKHNFSLLFCLLNIFYPLAASIPCFFSKGPLSIKVYSNMFIGRFTGYIKILCSPLACEFKRSNK